MRLALDPSLCADRLLRTGEDVPAVAAVDWGN
jgi:hypothetical protein